jgi:NitT/TauT family transport system ATP-binding protein
MLQTFDAPDMKADRAPPERMLALRLAGIRKLFLSRKDDVVSAIDGISLDVCRGDVIAIIGPSGCGKSSLLRILAGLDDEFSGAIDWTLDGAENQDGQRLRSATVFQGDSTLPWLSIERNLAIGMSGLRLDSKEAARRIAHYLDLVGLSDFRTAYPHELSGGMRQRIAIARALATEPQVLLMDEPLSALDPQTRLVMQQELLNIWRKTRSTVVYITHDIGEALTLADRIVVLTSRPGRIKTVIDVPFDHPRNVMDVRREGAFREMEADLWALVAAEVGETLGMPAGVRGQA